MVKVDVLTTPEPGDLTVFVGTGSTFEHDRFSAPRSG